MRANITVAFSWGVGMLRVASCLLAGLFAATVARAEPVTGTGPAGPAAGDPPARPRIGLVLSGGGARGAAHVGVLKVLEELHVPIDAIAGTSMGAVVGGLYASGMTPQQIETLMTTLDWQDAFSDRAPRQDLDIRRKQDDRAYLVRVPLGLKGREFRLPRGLISGQKLARVLRERMLPVMQVEDFDRLPIPFRAVATDLENGERVILGKGDLALAVRASMSAPGVFTPVELEGRTLVDGGIAENLPIDVARTLAVDRLIVVDVSYKPRPRRELVSAFDVSSQALAILMNRDTLRQLATLAPEDVVIEPPLEDMGSTDFGILEAARAIGESAARAQAARLAGLALDDAAWRQWQAQHVQPPAPTPVIQFVQVAPESVRYEPLIDSALRPVLGRPLDPAKLERSLARLYGDDVFETLDYRLVTRGDAAGLLVNARRKSYGPNYVRFGLQLQDDLDGGTSYTAGVRFQITEANRYGAEWVADLRIGQNPGVFTEFYEPLGYASPWFVAPRALFETRDLEVIVDDQRLASYRVRDSQVGLDFGRELGNWGELRAGLFRGHGSQRLRIGVAQEPDLPESASFDRGEGFFRFSLDRLDNQFFPRDGEALSLQWNAARTSLGADIDSDIVRADGIVARSFGRNTLALWASAGTAVSGPQTALANYFSLGGLFNLSGLAPNSLNGPHFGIARALLYRRVGRGGPGFLNVPAYAGFSVEWGNTWLRRSDIEFGDGRLNGAAFLGLDTLVGPIYLAAGFDERGRSAMYLLLGRTF